MRRRSARGKCYVCDTHATGCAVRSPQGGSWTGGPVKLEPACARHAWSEARIADARSGKRPVRQEVKTAPAPLLFVASEIFDAVTISA